MDRAHLLAPGYPRAAFVDAFYHVVWLRRDALVIPDDAAYDGFRAAFLTKFGCGPERPSMPESHVRHRADALFFGDHPWSGPIPLWAARCHTIVTSRDKWAVAEAIFLSEQAMPADERAGYRINAATIEFCDPQSAALEKILYTRNATALTAGIAVLCMAYAETGEHARRLYIDMREALRTGNSRTAEVADMASGVLHVLCRSRSDHELAPALVIHMRRLEAFWARYDGLHLSPHDIRSLASLRSRRGAQLECGLTTDHALTEQASEFGDHVEISWSSDVMSPLECRMTLRLWSALLGFVDPLHALIKPVQQGRHAIVLRKKDYARLLQYSPARLHCARIISLRMPVYKMVCQNYVEANMTRDKAGAVAVVKDLVSMLASDIPESATDVPHIDLGMLHGLLALFGDTLALHTTRPYLDPQDLQVCVRELPVPVTGLDSFLADPDAPTAFQNVADTASVVKGFAWHSETIYGCMLAFLCLREPHVMSRDAVRDLCKILGQRIGSQPQHRIGMSVLSDMWSRYSAPSVTILDTGYVDIPQEMPGIVPSDARPVSYVYGLLLSGLVERKQAARILMTIRLSPEKTPFLCMPTPLQLAETRAEGVPGLRAMHREYSGVPHGPFAELYTPPSVRELGCMQYWVFFLEMLTYVQGDVLHCDNLDLCRREYGRFGSRPHAPLTESTFRGAVTPHHVVRLARRDTTHDPSRTTHAYELERGLFQNQVVPTVRFAADARSEDYSRLAPGTPFAGADPFLLECVFMIPIDHVRIESSEQACKRKRASELEDEFTRSPRWQTARGRIGNGPQMTDAQWEHEVRIVEMALSSR